MRDLRPGESYSAADLNALRRQIAGLGAPSPSGFLGTEQGIGGTTSVDLRPGRVLARITSRGAGANYGWHQVVDNGNGTYFDQPLLPDVPWGTATAGPAWELGGREDVPTDGSVIVELVPGQQDVAGFYFRYDSAFGNSGSGAGSDGCCCELETVAFDVVTNVVCTPSGGLVVTRERISITGCNLSISAGDTPSGSDGGPVGDPCSIPFGTPCTLVVTGGGAPGTFNATWDTTGTGIATFAGAGAYGEINVQGNDLYYMANGINQDAPANCASLPLTAGWSGTAAENIGGLGTTSISFSATPAP